MWHPPGNLDDVLQCNNKRAVTQYLSACYFLGKKLAKLKTPEKLTASIKFALRMRSYCNGIVHGESDSNFMTKAELKLQVNRCFELRDFLGEEYSGLFTTSKSDRLKQKTQTARLVWIDTIDAVHKEKRNRLKHEAQLLAMQAQ